MAKALNDTSLKVDPAFIDYEDENDNIAESINEEDAKAVIEYFFSGDPND